MWHSRYVLGSAPREMERLITQSQILQPITKRLLTEAGLTHGMRVLDLGCGAGDVSFLAAKIVGSQGKVIGIDQASEAIALSKDRANQGSYENAEFYATSLEEFSIDTLEERLKTEVIAANAQIEVATQVCVWARI